MGFCGSMHCRRCFLEEGRAAWAMDCHCSFCLVVSLNSGGRVASAPLSREAIPPLERSLPPACVRESGSVGLLKKMWSLSPRKLSEVFVPS